MLPPTVSTTNENQHPEAPKSQLHWVHWTVVLASLVLTLGAWQFSRSQVEKQTEARFDKNADQVVELLAERMEKYENVLWGGVSAIHANGGEMTRHEWRVFAKSLQIDEKYPGINGIGVIHPVPHSNLRAYLKTQRKEIQGFKIHPRHSEDELLPITYIEPETTNFRAIGLDMAHEKNRYLAAKKARSTGAAQITGPIVLVQDQEKTPGFLFFAPYYQNKLDRKQPTKGKVFSGFVYAPFVVKNLMAGTLKKEKRHVGIQIQDGNEILYDEHDSNHKDFDSNPLFSKKIEVDFYGRTWKFDIRTTKSFRSASSSYQPLLILIGGITIDTLLLILFITLSRSQRNAVLYAKKVNKEAEAQRALAIQSSRLASLGEMAGGVAHEINNPLTIIAGFMMKLKKLIIKGNYKEEQLLEIIDKVENTVMRIAKIVKGMRSLSRDGSKDPFEEIKISSVVEDALSICTERFKVNGVQVDLSYSAGSEDTIVICRKVEVSQVLVNLLNNAFDAVKKQKEGKINLLITAEKDSARIEVIDNGEGISPEIKEKILTPFFTTKKVGEGTGLGLSISKSLISDNNGELFLDSQSQQTKFVILLPKKKNSTETIEHKKVS